LSVQLIFCKKQILDTTNQYRMKKAFLFRLNYNFPLTMPQEQYPKTSVSSDWAAQQFSRMVTQPVEGLAFKKAYCSVLRQNQDSLASGLSEKSDTV